MTFGLIKNGRQLFYRDRLYGQSQAGGMNRGIHVIAHEGARNHGLLNVGVSDFFNLQLPVPPPEHQANLATLFDLEDRLIELSEQLSRLRVQSKRGLMQRLLTGQVRVSVDEEEQE